MPDHVDLRLTSLALLLTLGVVVPAQLWANELDSQRRALEMPVRPRDVSEHVTVHDHTGDVPPGLINLLPHACGPIAAEYVYTGEVFSNMRGGIDTNRATRYMGLFQLALAFDFDEAGMFPGGKFVVLGESFHGLGLTENYVGDAQTLSNIDAPARTQVGEYWWERKFCDDWLTVRIGKQDVNQEFLVVDMASDFIQSSFGISPMLGVPTYPDASFGGVVLARLSESLEFKIGMWDGLPDGRNWGFSGSGSTLTLGELQYDWTLGGRLPGSLDFGVGYLSEGNDGDEYIPATWGFYVEAEQVVYAENPCDEDDGQGLGLFVQCGSGYDDAEVDLSEVFSVGMVYRGLIDGRDDDLVGVGYSRALLNFGGTGKESVVELFYKAIFSDYMMLQPDLQYIASPSGIHRDAFVAGLRFEVVL